MHQSANGIWRWSSSGSLTIVTSDHCATISKRAPQYEDVLAACEQDQLDLAVMMADRRRWLIRWAQDSEIQIQGHSLFLDGRQLTEPVLRQLELRCSEGLSPEVVIAGIRKIYADADTGRQEDHFSRWQLPQQLSGNYCEIAYLGWVGFLRRYGVQVLDTRRNYIEGTVEAVVASRKSGDRLLLATCRTGKVATLPLPLNVRLCQEAQDLLAGQGVTPFDNPISLGRT